MVAAVLVGLFVASAGPAAADPVNPSDAAIAAAAAANDALATQVGSLTAQLTVLQNQAYELAAAAESAEQKVAYTQQLLQEAQDTAVAAKADVASAQTAVDAARTKFNSSVRANYIDGSISSPGGALLTSTDPSAMLQTSALQSYVTAHQVDGIGQLDRATVAKANADAAARSAVDQQTKVAAEAQQALDAAEAASAAAAAQQQQTATQEAAVQAQLDTAQATLLGLQNQRAAYDAWKAQQAAIAAAAEQAREAAAAAAAAAAQPASRSSGGSSGGGGGGQVSSGNPTGGAWTAAKGQAAVNRALQWLGERYSFAAGNYNGPTWGLCVTHDAGWNDCHVFGFDCSGLSLYAWAPYIHLAHYTVTQYVQAGHFHPSTSQFMPGDLLFYGNTASTIHHVAIYIGGGNVVQAPQSGDVVKITPVNRMGSDYYGATRPLT